MTPLGEGIDACAAPIPPSSARAAVAPNTAFDFAGKLRELNFEPFDMLAYASLPEMMGDPRVAGRWAET
jgi:hypothetical protein